MKHSPDAEGDTPRIMVVLLIDLMESLAEKDAVRLEVPDPMSLTIAYTMKKSILEKASWKGSIDP